MNLIEMLLVGAIAQMQDQLIFKQDKTSIELVEAGDRVITKAGLGPNDWSDTVMVKAPNNSTDYLYVSGRKVLN